VNKDYHILRIVKMLRLK